MTSTQQRLLRFASVGAAMALSPAMSAMRLQGIRMRRAKSVWLGEGERLHEEALAERGCAPPARVRRVSRPGENAARPSSKMSIAPSSLVRPRELRARLRRWQREAGWPSRMLDRAFDVNRHDMQSIAQWAPFAPLLQTPWCYLGDYRADHIARPHRASQHGNPSPGAPVLIKRVSNAERPAGCTCARSPMRGIF